MIAGALVVVFGIDFCCYCCCCWCGCCCFCLVVVYTAAVFVVLEPVDFDVGPACLADPCHRPWLHVDGSMGGSVVFSKRHRGLLRGVELADSVRAPSLPPCHSLCPSLPFPLCLTTALLRYLTYSRFPSSGVAVFLLQVTVNPHKMLSVPLQTSMLLTARKGDLEASSGK